MGLFDFLKKKPQEIPEKAANLKPSLQISTEPCSRKNPDSFVDSSSVAPDERPFYQPDQYYTFYSNPGTCFEQRVIPFSERKQLSYPSFRGLYVAEILLLEYCKSGKMPKPKSGYQGFWWFQYGIRDVGHALESLEKRGFIQWSSKYKSLNSLKVEELKQILISKMLPTAGKKQDLINRIITSIPEQDLLIPEYVPKYELTELGKTELDDNGYVPYMHRHSRRTTEDKRFGPTFTVWDINQLFPDGDARNWRQIVGKIEESRFGVNVANAPQQKRTKTSNNQYISDIEQIEMRNYLQSKMDVIKKGIQEKGNGFEEESKGLLYKTAGDDKNALVMFYISIGKRFYAPALYKEAANILHKYRMYEEEINVLETGLNVIPPDSKYWVYLFEQKKQAEASKNECN